MSIAHLRESILVILFGLFLGMNKTTKKKMCSDHFRENNYNWLFSGEKVFSEDGSELDALVSGAIRLYDTVAPANSIKHPNVASKSVLY